ncbi:MAG: hypothetical protein O3C27_06100 [Actinomycetota bacterium]|nr:hypothetical protein [Actinomycetota bacterium]
MVSTITGVQLDHNYLRPELLLLEHFFAQPAFARPNAGRWMHVTLTAAPIEFHAVSFTYPADFDVA